MDMQSLMNKHKKPVFKEITDWTSSHDELRFKKDWWKMKTKLFIFFHPLGYKYFLFGVNLIGSIYFSLAATYFFLKDNVFFGIVFLILTIFMVKGTYVKARTWKVKSDITFYDVLMREI